MSKFSNLKLRYKVGVGVATGAAVLGMAGGAFAYFTDTATNTNGNATTGTSTPWSVGDPVTSGTMYPTSYSSPSSSATMTAVVKNVGSGHQGLNHLIVTLTGVTQEPSPPAGGCALSNYQLLSPTANWVVSGTNNVTGTFTPSSPVDIADGHWVGLTANSPSDSSTVVTNSLPTGLEIVMVNNPSGSQDGCKNATVQFSVTAN